MSIWREAAAVATTVDMMDNATALSTCPQQQQQMKLGGVIERDQERSSFQLRNRFKRSRCAGPIHGKKLVSAARYFISKVAFAKLYGRKTAITAADLLNDRLVPFLSKSPLP
jgi:hypothetical protein